MAIIKTKKDVRSYIKEEPMVIETRTAYEGDEPGGFQEIEDELVDLIIKAKGRPAYGTDWDSWFRDNLSELLDEAISIVM